SPPSLPSCTTVAEGTSLKGLLLALEQRAQLTDRCVITDARCLRRCDGGLDALDVVFLHLNDAAMCVLEVLVEVDQLIALAQAVDLVEAAVAHLREVQADLEQRARHLVRHLDAVEAEPEHEEQPRP